MPPNIFLGAVSLKARVETHEDSPGSEASFLIVVDSSCRLPEVMHEERDCERRPHERIEAHARDELIHCCL